MFARYCPAMIPLSKYALLLVSVSLVARAAAQEFNIGVHVNPVFTVPVADKKNKYDPAIKIKWLQAGVGAGMNFNIRFPKLCLELSPAVMTKTISFQQTADYTYKNIGGSSSTNGKYTLKAQSYSWEVPLTFAWLLDAHAAQTTYNLYAVAGTSFESNTTGGYSETSSSVSHGAIDPQTTVAYVQNTLPGNGVTTQWWNIILGFKINAILSRVGLIDYGISWHFPLSTASLHHFDYIIANNQYGSVYTADVYPRLSYIDVKLCYYFLNLQQGRKKYRFI